MRRGQVTEPICPVGGRAHGKPLPLDERWHCPHIDHEGRLPKHPLGPAPRTRSMFTDDEVFRVDRDEE